GHVRAGAADHRPFDDNSFLALLRQGPAQELARDAAADHQVLKVLGGHGDASMVRIIPRECPGREPLLAKPLCNRDADERTRHADPLNVPISSTYTDPKSRSASAAGRGRPRGCRVPDLSEW